MPMRSMPSRDYYVVLNVKPEATAAEIKLSYRKLALQYHPDRNNGNVHTEVLFKEINEAYGVLSNEEKRDDYNRLREAHKARVNTTTSQTAYSSTQNAQRRQPAAVTGKTILFHSTHLRGVVEKSNPFAINADSLFAKIESILSDSHIHILLLENRRMVVSQVIHEMLVCCRALPQNYFNAVTPRLYQLAGTDAIMKNAIQQAIKQKRQDFFWQKYKFWWVLIVTLMICLLIYFM